MVTIAQLEEEVSSRIAALDSSDFRQVQESWHENDTPLTAVAPGQSLSHLAYSVTIENAPVRDDGQGIADGCIDVLADMVVVFVYRLRATQQTVDYRLASEAARRVMSAIQAPYDLAVFFPRQAFKPGDIKDGLMPIELRFQVEFELPI